MRIFGLDITRAKTKQSSIAFVGDRGNWWWPIVREPFTGAWQRDVSITPESVLANQTIYACLERIASDIAKCRLRLVEQDSNGIWNEVVASAFTPVLTKPNDYQNRIQFFESWMISKLTMGNAYALKQRDARNVVTALYPLDPLCVTPMVADDGGVFYQLSRDFLSGVQTERAMVPASEIVHDLMTIKWHPLCGVPPLIAAGPAAVQGLSMVKESSKFFANSSRPSGILTAPEEITQDEGKRIKEVWQNEFSGENAGRIAVLGGGLKFEALSVTAMNAQLVEQMGLSAKQVAAAFGIPAFMVGASDPPTYNNVEALYQQYYSMTLQKHFESIELLLDEGLALIDVPGHTYGTEFDLTDLLRMDSATQIEIASKGVGSGIVAPNEARAKLGYGPVDGGAQPYLQQQNFSLEALSKRDAREDPFAKAAKNGGGGQPRLPAPAPEPVPAQASREFGRQMFKAHIEFLAA